MPVDAITSPSAPADGFVPACISVKIHSSLPSHEFSGLSRLRRWGKSIRMRMRMGVLLVQKYLRRRLRLGMRKRGGWLMRSGIGARKRGIALGGLWLSRLDLKWTGSDGNSTSSE